ncbi:hypothetical protein CKA32_005280 [Geitlerinema sp. FC II]|nr:hypothetical protein CKA32_005280 [Geitlerinema sp. FC II]
MSRPDRPRSETESLDKWTIAFLDRFSTRENRPELEPFSSYNV